MRYKSRQRLIKKLHTNIRILSLLDYKLRRAKEGIIRAALDEADRVFDGDFDGLASIIEEIEIDDSTISVTFEGAGYPTDAATG